MQYTGLDTARHDSKDTGVNAHEYSISAQAPASTSKRSPADGEQTTRGEGPTA